MVVPRLAIIADDLTGALDSAAPFAGIDGGVVVATHLMALPAALEAGGTGLKAPEAVFWGGYSGYWADLDGHVWEVAMTPFWPLGSDGSLTLPPQDAPAATPEPE